MASASPVLRQNLLFAAGYFGSEVKLAIRLGRTQPTVSAWINGKRQPPQAVMERLAALLAVHPADVLYGDVAAVLAARGGTDG